MLNIQELLKQNTNTNLLPLDTLDDIPLRTYLYDASGERNRRHFNAQILTKYLYNQGAQEINENRSLLNLYHNIPPHEGKNSSMRSANELQGVFTIYIALEKLEPSLILHAYKKLEKESVLMTNRSSTKLPNGTRFGFESALCSILYFYITKFNPNKFKRSIVTEIDNNFSNDSDRRKMESYLLYKIIFYDKDDTPMIDVFLDKAMHEELCHLINTYRSGITDSKPECSNVVPLRFFKKTVDDVATSSEKVSQPNTHCYVM